MKRLPRPGDMSRVNGVFFNRRHILEKYKKMNSIPEINEQSFETEVLKANVPVVVDFWAPWCGPCKMLAPVLEEISTETAGRAKVVKVNIQDYPELARLYHVEAIPTLLFFVDGEVRERTLGMVSKKKILTTLDSLKIVA